MALHKQGLDYYAHSIGMTDSGEMLDIRMAFGCPGVAVWFALLDIIYEREGYFVRYDNEHRNRTLLQVISKITGKDTPLAEEVHTIICYMARNGLFNERLFEEYGILTSRDIQMCYYMGTVRRKNMTVCRDIWLLSFDEMMKANKKHSLLKSFAAPTPSYDVDITCENADISDMIADIVRKSKVN